MTHQLSQKQLLELKYWVTRGADAEAPRRDRYIELFGLDGVDLSRHDILEVGTGPYWGMLPRLNGAYMCGVDPLYDAYYAMGMLADRNGIAQVSEPFEHWDTNRQFDLILTANALDHGEMGFYLIVKMWRMLKLGGRLCIHVHLRPPDLVNLLHDHRLTEEQLKRHLANTDLRPLSYRVYPSDVVDGWRCPTLVAVWEKPGDV
jgi:hypothetical protein